jgi:hypothetical protein
MDRNDKINGLKLRISYISNKKCSYGEYKTIIFIDKNDNRFYYNGGAKIFNDKCLGDIIRLSFTIDKQIGFNSYGIRYPFIPKNNNIFENLKELLQ